MQAASKPWFRRMVASGLVAVLAACGGTSAPPAASAAPSAAAAQPSATPNAGGTPETSKITVTFGTNSASTLPLWIAADKGIFKQNGLDAEVVSAESVIGARAVIVGQAQFFLGEATTSFQAAAEGSPVSIVATMQNLNIFKFLVAPSINSAADLKGKAIAISASGDSTELSTRYALKQLGLDAAKDVTLLQVGASTQRVAALVSGKVAGTLLSEPSAGQAKGQGMKVLLDLTTAPFIAGAVTVSKQFASSNPNTVLAFLRSLVQGTRFLTDPKNKDESLKVLGKWQKLPPTDKTVISGYEQYSGDVLAKDPSPNVAGAQALLDGLQSLDAARFGKLTTGAVLDPSFMLRLENAGFIKQVWGS